MVLTQVIPSKTINGYPFDADFTTWLLVSVRKEELVVIVITREFKGESPKSTLK